MKRLLLVALTAILFVAILHATEAFGDSTYRHKDRSERFSEVARTNQSSDQPAGSSVFSDRTLYTTIFEDDFDCIVTSQAQWTIVDNGAFWIILDDWLTFPNMGLSYLSINLDALGANASITSIPIGPMPATGARLTFDYAFFDIADEVGIPIGPHTLEVRIGSTVIHNFAAHIVSDTYTSVDIPLTGLTAGQNIQLTFFVQYGDTTGWDDFEFILDNVQVLVPEGTHIVDFTTPSRSVLHTNYPNPFNPTTTIAFTLPHAENVKIDVYNAKGQLVSSLINREFSAGSHTVVWDGTDDMGTNVGSGIYFYKMSTADFHDVKKMIMVK
jgi:hypothetical protein